ncbi:hypothetical protein VVD49_04250 [Uliginosibacterium sp. H3]|uniref:DUF11 domain-containing protein n=1 Tax=Uliginosibacterium silvisoli TaxID=3114758 RepID=A0ABU6JZV1_9RHOO|nr:hypothetical protein [Uliginosibacterium sp. H3]
MNKIAWILAGALLLPWAYVSAQQGGISVQLDAFKVSVAAGGGREVLTPAEAVLPGDTLEYRAVYKNNGKTLARNVEATLPIPAGNTAYLADSASPRNPLASSDGNRFEAMPLKRIVIGQDGQRQTQIVPLSEYRALRWKLGDLAAGASMTVTTRVRIATLESAGSGPAASDAGRKAGGNVATR